MNKKVLKEVAKMKVYVGPFIQSTTGAAVPFFNDSRCLYSHPKVIEVVADELSKKIKKRIKRSKRNLLIGIPMAGIPIALAVSLKTRIPFAYLNKEKKKTLRKKWVEGDYQKGAVGILLDDVVAMGNTVLDAIKHCRKDGINVKHVAIIQDPWQMKNQSFKKKLRKMGVTFDALYNRHEWIQYLYQNKKISKEALEIQEAYLADPLGWHKNKIIWRKFLEFKKKNQL